MKPLSKIDLGICYNDALSTIWDRDYKIRKLIKGIEKEDNPANFKDDLLAITQLYFDGMVEKNLYSIPILKAPLLKIPLLNKKKIWKKQEEILNKLNTAGKNAISSFYRGEGIDFDNIKEIIIPSASQIIKYASKIPAKKRHLYGHDSDVQKFGLKLTDILEKEKSFDTIVCITSGGFEPSFLAMDIMEKENLVPIRYSWVRRNDDEVKIPKYAPKDYVTSGVRDKKVLVIDDVVAGGQSMGRVVEYINKNKPKGLWTGSVWDGAATTGSLREEY